MTESLIYVYQTICEVNGKCYVGIHKTDNINDGYIGCGVYGLNDAKKHLLFHRAVKKHGYASFKRHILSFYDTYEEAKQEEKYIVDYKWINSKDNYNTALGGSGSTTAWMCDEDKKKWKSNISEGVMKWMDNGGREIVSFNAKNIKRKRFYGADNHLFGKPNPRRKKILQYSISGELVQVHDSINHAGRYFNTTPGNITSCCKGRYRTCKGFVFRYDNYNEIEKTQLEINLRYKQGNKRVILQYDLNGNFINEYKSIMDAVRASGCAKVTIDKFLSGKIKSCKGFIFKYK